MATVAQETEPLQEQETQSPRLLWLPVIYPFEVFRKHPPAEGELSAWTSYWQRAEKFLAPALAYKGTVHLYLEGIYPELLGGGITSSTHVSFDQIYPEFDHLIGQVKEEIRARKRQTPGNFDQWSIILTLLGRKGSTWVEVCDYSQRCLRLEEIERQIMKEPRERTMEVLKRIYRKELGEFSRERRREFEARVKETLKPDELELVSKP